MYAPSLILRAGKSHGVQIYVALLRTEPELGTVARLLLNRYGGSGEHIVVVYRMSEIK